MGGLNLAAYGVSLFTKKENYSEMFGYRGYPQSASRYFKSLIGCDKLVGIWTAPALILLNAYFLRSFGSLFMSKFFALSVFSTYAFYSIFNPASGLNVRLLKSSFPNFDCWEDGQYYMGADIICNSLIYFFLLYHRLHVLVLPCMLFDLVYYGPASYGGPTAALIAAWCVL